MEMETRVREKLLLTGLLASLLIQPLFMILVPLVLLILHQFLKNPLPDFPRVSLLGLSSLPTGQSTLVGYFELNRSQYAAADDDPLPGIEGLQISGEAFPGRELQACGYSTNGTTSCNFEV